MTKTKYAFVVKFKMSERIPSYSDIESFVPRFVDAFFERRSTRVSKNGMEVWVHVNKPKHNDTMDVLDEFKQRLDTPRSELKHYEPTLSLNSTDVEFAHMEVDEFVEQTEHSAAILNADWNSISFYVDDEDESSYHLIQENNSDIKVKVSKYDQSYHTNLEIMEQINTGQRICATLGSRSGAGRDWYFQEIFTEDSPKCIFLFNS